MNEHIQQLKEIRAVVLTLPDTPVRLVPEKVIKIMTMLDASAIYIECVFEDLSAECDSLQLDVDMLWNKLEDAQNE